MSDWEDACDEGGGWSSDSSGAADDEGDGYNRRDEAALNLPPLHPPPGFVFDDLPPDWAGSLDIEELVQTLLGLPVADAEEEVREALKKVGGEASDADTIAILLRVFRLARESALAGYDDWESPVEYCGRLLPLVDRNFLGAASGTPRPQDFPPSMVGAVYAECGRTMSMAGNPSKGRDLLQKALNVFALLPSSNADESDLRQVAATHASLGRVLRRLDQTSRSQDSFLQSLQVLADLPREEGLEGLINEYCEVVTEAGESATITRSLVELVAALAEDKFGEGTPEHMKALRELADACVAAGRFPLASAVLATRARLLRLGCSAEGRAALAEVAAHFGGIGSGRGKTQKRTVENSAWAEADAQAAEEEAAQAMEAASAQSMEEGDFEFAAICWEEAIFFREQALEEGSEVLESMRESLQMLQQVAEAKAAAEAEAEAEAEAGAEAEAAEAEESLSAAGAEEAPPPDSWDDGEDEPTKTKCLKTIEEDPVEDKGKPLSSKQELSQEPLQTIPIAGSGKLTLMTRPGSKKKQVKDEDEGAKKDIQDDTIEGKESSSSTQAQSEPPRASKNLVSATQTGLRPSWAMRKPAGKAAAEDDGWDA